MAMNEQHALEILGIPPKARKWKNYSIEQKQRLINVAKKLFENKLFSNSVLVQVTDSRNKQKYSPDSKQESELLFQKFYKLFPEKKDSDDSYNKELFSLLNVDKKEAESRLAKKKAKDGNKLLQAVNRSNLLKYLEKELNALEFLQYSLELEKAKQEIEELELWDEADKLTQAAENELPTQQSEQDDNMPPAILPAGKEPVVIDAPPSHFPPSVETNKDESSKDSPLPYVHEIEGKGNCLFGAIAQACFNNQYQYPYLKTLVVEQIRKESNNLKNELKRAEQDLNNAFVTGAEEDKIENLLKEVSNAEKNLSDFRTILSFNESMRENTFDRAQFDALPFSATKREEIWNNCLKERKFLPAEDITDYLLKKQDTDELVAFYDVQFMKEGRMGGEFEALYLEKALKLPIIVVHKNMPSYSRNICKIKGQEHSYNFISGEEPNAAQKDAIILYYDGEHYDLLTTEIVLNNERVFKPIDAESFVVDDRVPVAAILEGSTVAVAPVPTTEVSSGEELEPFDKETEKVSEAVDEPGPESEDVLESSSASAEPTLSIPVAEVVSFDTDAAEPLEEAEDLTSRASNSPVFPEEEAAAEVLMAGEGVLPEGEDKPEPESEDVLGSSSASAEPTLPMSVAEVVSFDTEAAEPLEEVEDLTSRASDSPVVPEEEAAAEVLVGGEGVLPEGEDKPEPESEDVLESSSASAEPTLPMSVAEVVSFDTEAAEPLEEVEDLTSRASNSPVFPEEEVAAEVLVAGEGVPEGEDEPKLEYEDALEGDNKPAELTPPIFATEVLPDAEAAEPEPVDSDDEEDSVIDENLYRDVLNDRAEEMDEDDLLNHLDEIDELVSRSSEAIFESGKPIIEEVGVLPQPPSFLRHQSVPVTSSSFANSPPIMQRATSAPEATASKEKVKMVQPQILQSSIQLVDDKKSKKRTASEHFLSTNAQGNQSSVGSKETNIESDAILASVREDTKPSVKKEDEKKTKPIDFVAKLDEDVKKKDFETTFVKQFSKQCKLEVSLNKKTKGYTLDVEKPSKKDKSVKIVTPIVNIFPQEMAAASQWKLVANEKEMARTMLLAWCTRNPDLKTIELNGKNPILCNEIMRLAKREKQFKHLEIRPVGTFEKILENTSRKESAKRMFGVFGSPSKSNPEKNSSLPLELNRNTPGV